MPIIEISVAEFASPLWRNHCDAAFIPGIFLVTYPRLGANAGTSLPARVRALISAVGNRIVAFY
jgi:hypothetical protein